MISPDPVYLKNFGRDPQDCKILPFCNISSSTPSENKTGSNRFVSLSRRNVSIFATPPVLNLYYAIVISTFRKCIHTGSYLILVIT
jgi:hypothetical protein